MCLRVRLELGVLLAVASVTGCLYDPADRCGPHERLSDGDTCVCEADAVVVSVAGELDALAAPQLDDFLAPYVAERPSLLVLDLSGVTFLDSTGLGVVIKALKHVREHGGEVAAVYTSPRVAKVFQITGIDQAMVVGASVEAVVAGRS